MLLIKKSVYSRFFNTRGDGNLFLKTNKRGGLIYQGVGNSCKTSPFRINQENIFWLHTSVKFSYKLSAHTLGRIIIENLSENIKLVWWQKLCFIFVARLVHI